MPPAAAPALPDSTPRGTPRDHTALSHRGASPGLPRAAGTEGGRAQALLPGRGEGWPGLRALAGGLRLSEAQPGAPQGPGAGGSAGLRCPVTSRSLVPVPGGVSRENAVEFPRDWFRFGEERYRPGYCDSWVLRRLGALGPSLSLLCVIPSCLPPSGAGIGVKCAVISWNLRNTGKSSAARWVLLLPRAENFLRTSSSLSRVE